MRKKKIIHVGKPPQARLLSPGMFFAITHKTTTFLTLSDCNHSRTATPDIICGGGSSTMTPFVKFLMSCRNGWSIGRNCRCLSNEEYLPPFANQMNLIAALHTGQGNFPCTHHPQNIAYAGKSCREYMYHTRILKFVFVARSYVHTPSSQAWSKSSIRGSIYTLILSPGYPGIINDKNMFCR